MAKSYESRYSVHPEYIPELRGYRGALHSVEMSGGMPYYSDGKLSAICYCAYIILLFRQRELPVWDSIGQKDTTIDGMIFLESFEKGFAKGVAYFDKRYSVPPTVIYSSPEYIETIKRLYSGDSSEWPEKHCLRMIRQCPITLERSQFEEIGRWSGITFRIQSLISEHPGIFDTEITTDEIKPTDIFDTEITTSEIKPINILQDARPALINALLPYVDASQHDTLKALINEGTYSSHPIVCDCKQVEIGAIFYERVSKAQITTFKTIVAKWICQHFCRRESGEVKKLTESVILNHLKNAGLGKNR